MIKMKLGKDGENRSYVILAHEKRRVPKRISALILETFVSPRPAGMEVCHGIKGSLVDTLDNLYWGTHQQNINDKIRDGTLQMGEQIVQHKLNEFQVRIIRKAYSFRGINGVSGKELAEIFGVGKATISFIVNNINWKHLTPTPPQ